MTVIMAAIDETGMYIGSDSRMSGEVTFTDHGDKLMAVHDCVVGVAGSHRVSQLVRYNATSLASIKCLDDLYPFSEGLKSLVLDDVHSTRRLRRRPQDWSFQMLGVAPFGIFAVHASFTFLTYPHSWAIGSGGAYALGIFRGAAVRDDLSTRSRMQLALTSSEAYAIGVGGDFTVLRVGDAPS